MVCTYTGNRDEAIVAYLYDDITAVDRAAFDAHMASCVVCRDEMAELRHVRSRMAEYQPPTFGAFAARSADASAPRPRSFWADVPVWAQTLAAMLVLGVAAGAANLEIRHDAGGFSVRTGWIASAPAPAPAPSDEAPWRADLAKLASDLRAERATVERTAAAPAAASDAELLKQVKALIASSEKKEENELALHLAQVVRDNQAARNADLVKIDRALGLVSNNANYEVARNREILNTLAMRVSQTVR